MENITAYMRDLLLDSGADKVAFGDIRELEPHARHHLPVGIVIAIAYPKEVIRGIHDAPTPVYRSYYDSINERLDSLVTLGEKALVELGYRAFAQTRKAVGGSQSTPLPHKTVATRAGLGWIGKCALLVTEDCGSAIRLSSLLTDAPLQATGPIDQSKCGECMVCANACPGSAVRGVNWRKGDPREAYFDADACRQTARVRSLQALGEEITLCGKCIEVCPYTRAYTR